MAFNIYEWRRNQLLIENSIYNNPDDLYTGNLDAGKKEDDKKMLQQLLNWYKSQDDANPAMISKLEMQIGGINKNKVKVNDIEFSVKDSYPIDVAMGSGDKFEDENDFIAWKADFIEKYGNIELERGIIGWKVPSDNEIGKQAQADFDKYARRK